MWKNAFKRTLLSIVILGAAAGGPIGYFAAGDAWKAVRKLTSSPKGDEAQPWQAAALADPSLPQPLPQFQAPLEGLPVRNLAEVFRFDITPGWVMHRWPRVTTGLSLPQLEGYRVELVTGTTPADLAGSLTYYFNPQQQLQQISFHGSTGDVRNLARLLTTRFSFSRRLANDPALVVYEAVAPDGHKAGVARIRSAWVVKSSNPLQRFEVDLTVERPGKDEG